MLFAERLWRVDNLMQVGVQKLCNEIQVLKRVGILGTQEFAQGDNVLVLQATQQLDLSQRALGFGNLLKN